MNIPQGIVRVTSKSKQDNWDFASLQIQGLQDESRDGEELRLELVEMEREDGNQLWSDDEIGAELTKVRLCGVLWQNGRILQWSNYVSTAPATLHFELHPSSFSATTFSISIVENLELGVVDWEEGGLSGKCDSVRVDCKKLHTQNLLWHIIAER